MKTKHIPQRKCVCCGEKKPKCELIRITLLKNNEAALDNEKLIFGRGAYICNNEKCFDILVKKSVLSRAFRKNVSQKEHEKLRGELSEWKKSLI